MNTRTVELLESIRRELAEAPQMDLPLGATGDEEAAKKLLGQLWQHLSHNVGSKANDAQAVFNTLANAVESASRARTALRLVSEALPKLPASLQFRSDELAKLKEAEHEMMKHYAEISRLRGSLDNVLVRLEGLGRKVKAF